MLLRVGHSRTEDSAPLFAQKTCAPLYLQAQDALFRHQTLAIAGVSGDRESRRILLQTAEFAAIFDR
jgi:hypothetical protein